MKEKIKKNLVGFIIGVITTFSISVIAATYFPSNDVTYDNKESGLSSTNVQGAIDELYGVCTAKPSGEQIIEDAGLEKDPYECRYFFTGANPNNYITFNNEPSGWRIISVECDGTIKIMRTPSIGDMAWDTSDNNNWARPASLNTYLNNTYYNELNITAQNQIIAKNFSIGGVEYDDESLSNSINNENSKKYHGKIGLVTITEYLRSNSDIKLCGTPSLIHDNYINCQLKTWMYYLNNHWWTINNQADYNFPAMVIHSNGDFYSTSVSTKVARRPTIYLSSNIKITGGNGSQLTPYTIE